MIEAAAPEEKGEDELEAWGAFGENQTAALGRATTGHARSRRGWRKYWVTRGTMTEYSHSRHRSVALLEAVLRGFGQVFFLNNPASGLAFLVAIAWVSPYLATLGLLGCVASTASALALLNVDGLVRCGLFGYNGALVGVALGLFHVGSSDDWGAALPQLLFAVPLMAAFSSLAQAAVSNVLVPGYGVAPLTFPFQLVTWLWLLCSQTSGESHFPLDGSVLQPGLAVVAAEGDARAVGVDWAPAAEALLVNVAQVFLLEDAAAGALILVGIAAASPISAAMAVAGSLASLLTAFAVGAPEAAIYAGLWGYNGVLAAMAVGGVFFTPTRRTMAVALLAAALATVAGGGVAGALRPLGMPALTFPFTLVVWLFALTGGSLHGVQIVKLESLTVAEDHYARAKALQRWEKLHRRVSVGALRAVAKTGSVADLASAALGVSSAVIQVAPAPA